MALTGASKSAAGPAAPVVAGPTQVAAPVAPMIAEATAPTLEASVKAAETAEAEAPVAGTPPANGPGEQVSVSHSVDVADDRDDPLSGFYVRRSEEGDGAVAD